MSYQFISYDNKINYSLTFENPDNLTLLISNDASYHHGLYKGESDSYPYDEAYDLYHYREAYLIRRRAGYELGNIIKTYNFQDLYDNGARMYVRGNNVVEFFYYGVRIPVIGYTIGKLYK
jgi:hypothetical protein